MVTRETAERIAETCNEIKECEQALAILKSRCKCASHFLFVAKDEKDEGITLSVSRAHALIIVKEILSALNSEYANLNNTALKEANSKV
jgi:hypothetical protein